MPKVTFDKDVKQQTYYFKKKVIKNKGTTHIICVDSVYTEHKRYAKHCG